MAVQRFGMLSAFAGFFIGASLGFEMTSWNAVFAITLAAVVLGIVTVLTDIAGQREGLSIQRVTVELDEIFTARILGEVMVSGASVDRAAVEGVVSLGWRLSGWHTRRPAHTAVGRRGIPWWVVEVRRPPVHIRVVLPVIGDGPFDQARAEVASWADPGTRVDTVSLERGTA